MTSATSRDMEAAVEFDMNFEDYQKQATETAVYPERYKVIYPTMGLAGEAGEVANKLKKIYRDRDGVIDEDAVKEVCAEIGDVLWYCAALCTDLGVGLDTVAEANLKKLQDRSGRNAVNGSGDNR